MRAAGPRASGRRGRLAVPGVLLVAVGLVGCGSTVADPQPTAVAASQRPVPAQAARALDCVHEVSLSGAGDYVDSGLETVQDDPESAVANLVRESYVGGLPRTGFELLAVDDGRALVVTERDGSTVVAFVVEDGLSDWDGNVGWGVTSYAACDLAELPPEVAAAEGTEVWTDAEGAPVPTSRVQSSAGPEHCDWQDITFLQVGKWRDGQQYLRDVDGALVRWTRTSYAEEVPLPEDATDSGWRRDGRALWLVPDHAAYLVDLGDRTGPAVAERWPAAEERVACM